MTLTTPLTREALAARDLLAAHKDIIGDDEAFAMDVVEGETNLFEVVNVLVAQEGEDKARIAALDAYAAALLERVGRIKVRIGKRRFALQRAFETAGITKPMRCAMGTVSLRATPPGAAITDKSLIPEEFWRPAQPTLDLIALKAALKEGRKIPGAELSNGGVSISIRTT